MLEIDYIEGRIRGGVEARKRLSPSDSLRVSMQIEIDTLRDRRDDMRSSADAEGERIEGHARDHFDTKKRKQLKEQRRAVIDAAEAATARDFEKRVHSAEQVEQDRLEKQERAQNWLYGEPDR